ncbi:MAG TPA: HigA family addiction module antitoxin [Gemmatimonadales bacterium]|jgi:addiction module HigA family antidote|nr:HigA family addiction module antitoxin [Gemmatimonadales bacterium]
MVRRKSAQGQPVHPGQILFTRYVTPLGVTQRAVARALGVHVSQVNSVILGDRGVSADLALRLARVLGTTPRYWLDLQQRWDLAQVQQSAAGKRIARLKRLTRKR